MNTMRVAGVDLGKSSAKLVIARAADGAMRVESTSVVVHRGAPLRAFAEWYREEKLGACVALGATGIHADEVIPPAVTGLPDGACLEAALRVRGDLEGPLNLVSVGARGYAVMARHADGRVSYLENEKCSSGTGETMVKTAARFGLDLEAADRIASSTGRMIPITARCSVFAKSEMTHFGNQGRPVEQLFRGYFDSIARYVAALLARVRADGPVLLIGGGSRIATLRERLACHLDVEVFVPDGALAFEATGAAQIAAEQASGSALEPLPEEPESLLRPKRRSFTVLPAASGSAHLVRRLQAPPVPDGAADAPTVLGLDLGSTGSKAVLTSLDTGEIAVDVYDQTRGNPVEAAQRLVGELLKRADPDVRAIGVTGSGREAVATVLRAAYPEHAGRIVVINEIVAHATAAIRCDDEHGESLSVVEIGGQDAKFVQVADGRIVESDMNKACSAGTGSFLEEQAVFYGVHDIADFTEKAQKAERPPDLGQMCTVFVAEAAAEAQTAGFSTEDLFGGFQYSVVHNYLNRVMGQRTFARRIFFQGKPATGPSLAWTLAAVTGREVVVPPNPGAMGAWGIGICAIDELGRSTLSGAERFDLARLLGASVAERTEFQCRDSKCATLCTIDRAKVDVGGTRQIVFTGGACPKFEVAAAGKKKLPMDAPSSFDEREASLARFVEDSDGEPLVGIPAVGSTAGILPWIATLCRELGLGVRVLRPQPSSLSKGEELCYSYDACAPAKVAHGITDADVDLLLLPKVLDLPDREGPGGRTCAMEQALPDTVGAALRARGRDKRIVAPVISLRAGLVTPALLVTLGRTARQLGADPARAIAAAQRAATAQAAYERGLREIGERTLAYGRRRGIPVVVICGSLHVLFDPCVNAGVPGILRQNGALALPMDCFPIPSEVGDLPRIAWQDANRALRVALAARGTGTTFPLLLTSFGCGPASFVEQIFDVLLHGYPHTALETDGHGGAAGYVTRIQSFLHGVRSHDGSPSEADEATLKLVEPLASSDQPIDPQSRIVMFPVGDRLSSVAAAAYRSVGYQAVAAGPSSAETFAHGRRDCSGKECLPYQLIWGSFRKQLSEDTNGGKTVLLQVTGQGACRNCMFSIKDQINLTHLGMADRVSVRHFGSEREAKRAFLGRFWPGVVAWDVFYQLASFHRASERAPGAVDTVYEHYCDDLIRRVGRAVSDGWRGARDRREHVRSIAEAVERGSWELAEAGGNGDEKRFRTVLLSGDIYVRLDEFASDGLVRKLNAHGIRVLVEPTCSLVEYLGVEYSAELLGLPTGLLEGTITKLAMTKMKQTIYERARAANPWLPVPDVVKALEVGRKVLDRYPLGEAPLTIGNVLSAWNDRHCDGVVVAGPWGCAPALISEGLLRHEREIPILFVYADGSPLDDRRLNGFAYRVKQSPPRTVSPRAFCAPRSSASASAAADGAAP